MPAARMNSLRRPLSLPCSRAARGPDQPAVQRRRGAIALADDEVAFPVLGDLAVCGLDRSLVDQRTSVDEPMPLRCGR
jgi:hypothetical protein